jgi:peptidoglycan/LPS O-acetylase OafA/YrhL
MGTHSHPGVQSALIASAASICIAYLTLRFYDEPVRRWLGRVGSTPRLVTVAR